jgi:hypothetical protein
VATWASRCSSASYAVARAGRAGSLATSLFRYCHRVLPLVGYRRLRPSIRPRFGHSRSDVAEELETLELDAERIFDVERFARVGGALHQLVRLPLEPVGLIELRLRWFHLPAA